jgi:hypothetical protein
MTPQEAIEYINQILETVVQCNGPERNKLRLAVRTIVNELAEKKEDKKE